MSLLGKILALLNVFGAIGLVCLASMDYGKRQSWAYSVHRFDLADKGLPVTEEELDADSVPRVDRISEDTLQQIFSPVGGSPVPTQKKEVERVKRLLDEKIAAAAQSKAQQCYVYSRILLPLTDAYKEREQMLTCRAHFATEQSANALKTRCRESFEEAIKPNPNVEAKEQRSFGDAFRLAFRARPGEPADLFVADLLQALPEDREKAKAESAKFDAVYDAVIEKNRKELEDRYAAAFAEALGEAPQGGAKPGQGTQKVAIARLLHGLCLYLSEGPQAPADRSADQAALAVSTAYRQNLNRVFVVCGVRAGLNAIANRASELVRLSDYVLASTTQERTQFITDHNTLIDQIRDEAARVAFEQKLYTENTDRLASATQAVKERTVEIEKVEDDLKKAREATDAEIKKLRDKSYEVLKARQKTRETIEAIERAEKDIRELEKQATTLDRRNQ